MLCKSFDQLTIVEKREFIGTLLHLAQSYEDVFKQCKHIILKYDISGALDRIKINPENIEEHE